MRSPAVLESARRSNRLSLSAFVDDVAEQLAGWGKVVTVETRGRVTGRPVAVAVGYLEEGDDLLVAAGSADADWARNLAADPACRIRFGEATWSATAESVDGPEAGRVVRDLILKYGTPAERLGRGPVFRLARAPGGAQADR